MDCVQYHWLLFVEVLLEVMVMFTYTARVGQPGSGMGAADGGAGGRGGGWREPAARQLGAGDLLLGRCAALGHVAQLVETGAIVHGQILIAYNSGSGNSGSRVGKGGRIGSTGVGVGTGSTGRLGSGGSVGMGGRPGTLGNGIGAGVELDEAGAGATVGAGATNDGDGTEDGRSEGRSTGAAGVAWPDDEASGGPSQGSGGLVT